MKTINKKTCHYRAWHDNPVSRYPGQARVWQEKQARVWHKAFTLVELIIVITILAILATIAFISFQNYTKDARDGNRVATIKNIESWLELYSIKTWNYPTPDGPITILSWWTIPQELSIKWYIWETVSQAIKVSKLPTDPYDNTQKYIYATTPNKKLYQIATIKEWDIVSQTPFITQTYAFDFSKYKARVQWNFKAGTVVNGIPLFSLIFWWTGDATLTGTTLFITNSTTFSWATISNLPELKELVKKINEKRTKAWSWTINETELLPILTWETESWALLQEIKEVTWNTQTSNGSTPLSQAPVETANNCLQETIDDYIVDATNDNSEFNAEKQKIIDNWTQTYKQKFTCTNWRFSKTWEEEILTPTCYEDYIASWNTCVLDSCTGTRPENSELNGTQWSKAWSWSQTETWVCKYKCIDWYETANCTAKTKVVTSATYNSRNYIFPSFTLTYWTWQTETSQALSIEWWTSTLTAKFTLESDWTTVNLSEQSEVITCNTAWWYEQSGDNCVLKTYTITFDGNWATSGSMTPQNITANTSANLTNNWFTKTWFNFLWWNTNKLATTATHTNQASYTIGTANVTLYAIWASSCPWSECLSNWYYVAASNWPTWYNSCAVDVSGYDKTKCILRITSVTPNIYVAPSNSDTTATHANCNNCSVWPWSTNWNAATFCTNLKNTIAPPVWTNWFLPPRDTWWLQTIQQNISKVHNVWGSDWYWSSSFHGWDGSTASWRFRWLVYADWDGYFWDGQARVRCIAK